MHFLAPVLKLTGLFHAKETAGCVSGNASPVKLLHRSSGNIEGLKMLGINAKNHPKWKIPFIKDEYFSDEECAFPPWPYYNSMKLKYSDALPFHISLFSLSAVQLLTDGKVKFELGEDYCFGCSPHKVRHDMNIGRLRADKNSDLRNFGVKKWWMVSGGPEDVMVDIARPLEGSET